MGVSVIIVPILLKKGHIFRYQVTLGLWLWHAFFALPICTFRGGFAHAGPPTRCMGRGGAILTVLYSLYAGLTHMKS